MRESSDIDIYHLVKECLETAEEELPETLDACLGEVETDIDAVFSSAKGLGVIGGVEAIKGIWQGQAKKEMDFYEDGNRYLRVISQEYILEIEGENKSLVVRAILGTFGKPKKHSERLCYLANQEEEFQAWYFSQDRSLKEKLGIQLEAKEQKLFREAFNLFMQDNFREYSLQTDDIRMYSEEEMENIRSPRAAVDQARPTNK